MVFRKESLRKSEHDGFCGGDGITYQLHFLEKEQAFGAGKVFCIARQEPGTSVGLHTHTENIEVYYILKGQALVTDDGEEKTMHAGDVMVTPIGHSHSMLAVGPEDLEYITLIIYENPTMMEKLGL